MLQPYIAARASKGNSVPESSAERSADQKQVVEPDDDEKVVVIRRKDLRELIDMVNEFNDNMKAMTRCGGAENPYAR
jgi:hypothetical protein